MKVLATREADIDAYRAVFDAVARERRYLGRLEAPGLDQVTRFIQECLEKRRPHFLVWDGDQAVGWCDIIEKLPDTMRHSGVLGMGVVASHRGRGLGRALMTAALADARQKDFKRVELTVRVDNDRAKALYEQFGFAIEGRIRRHMLVDGEYQDSWLMAVLYD
jgi:ribosomal protein S18 acetylase RimI-like enzyme